MAVIRLGLAVLPFGKLSKLLTRLAESGEFHGKEDERDSAIRERAVWAVERAGHHFPAVSTCLTQALAAHVLLGRRGHKSNLRIGAGRNPDGSFLAHAWLEQDGIIYLGGTCHSSFTPMPVLNGLKPPSHAEMD